MAPGQCGRRSQISTTKSWCPWRQDNKEKVKADEEKYKEEQEAEAQKERETQSKNSTDILRERLKTPKVDALETNVLTIGTRDEGTSEDNFDLSCFSSADDLEQLGLDLLKRALVFRGLKCGGSLKATEDESVLRNVVWEANCCARRSERTVSSK